MQLIRDTQRDVRSTEVAEQTAGIIPARKQDLANWPGTNKAGRLEVIVVREELKGERDGLNMKASREVVVEKRASEEGSVEIEVFELSPVGRYFDGDGYGSPWQVKPSQRGWSLADATIGDWIEIAGDVTLRQEFLF